MKPEDFITDYERALASHSWEAVAPLIHADAVVTFSNGSVHKGNAAIKRAFERNFALIRDEKYAISNVFWVRKSPDTAVFVCGFAWEGYIDGLRAEGAGVGTSVLVNDEGQWRLLVEHLGSAPRND
ncbi:MAG: nuclear transport factor 2 family protein [Pseudomonadota bacterium]|nr:nuclear transport factor 2 family protein [Pseudomonadota bacterium]